MGFTNDEGHYFKQDEWNRLVATGRERSVKP